MLSSIAIIHCWRPLRREEEWPFLFEEFPGDTLSLRKHSDFYYYFIIVAIKFISNLFFSFFFFLFFFFYYFRVDNLTIFNAHFQLQTEKAKFLLEK